MINPVAAFYEFFLRLQAHFRLLLLSSLVSALFVI